MRLWSLHPRHLDRQGLVAGWREALLAQAVLAGDTTGYRNHPQLERFRAQDDPLGAIGDYLCGLHEEATARGYHFDRTRIRRPAGESGALAVTSGQIAHEWSHLGAKLADRSPDDAQRLRRAQPECHPLFHVVDGPIEAWERP
ncbi:MAG TPA: hypothetical protein IAA98_14180 [Candidatus Avipropionibacterium avicola]|uniref:Pyrimidine dimer DNA glycosylase n=1 Tax=Candidatus Avipropionibacterium avicola TaxID=2840701 RepID=A0A9D1KNH3_9ACTN|nr:hypothetical protein [Candidatus Avipropionibacterium avicola]